MKTFTSGQQVILTKTNVINDHKLIGKKAKIDFQCKDGMVWVVFGRACRCVHPDYLQVI